MKKILTVLFAISGLILVSGCSLTNNQSTVDVNSGLVQQISLLQEQLSGMNNQFQELRIKNDELTKENETIKLSLGNSNSGESLLLSQNEELKKEIEKYKQALIQEKLQKKVSDTKAEITKTVVLKSCAKEGETYNNGIDAQGPFSCCEGLKGFIERSIDGKSMPLCYDPKKGNLTCIVDGHRTEGRYYSNGDLLKQDVNCKSMNSDFCKKEGDFANPQKAEICCSGLKEYYGKPGDPSFSICYNESKGKPSCIIDGHRLEGWYYSNGDLLKQDVNCK